MTSLNKTCYFVQSTSSSNLSQYLPDTKSLYLILISIISFLQHKFDPFSSAHWARICCIWSNQNVPVQPSDEKKHKSLRHKWESIDSPKAWPKVLGLFLFVSLLIPPSETKTGSVYNSKWVDKVIIFAQWMQFSVRLFVSSRLLTIFYIQLKLKLEWTHNVLWISLASQNIFA